MNTILVALMIINFYLYTGVIVYKYGVLPSISESYYRTGKKIWFTVFCWLLALPAIIVGDSFLMFLAGSAIAFTGAASAFKERYVYKIHFIGAIIGIVLSLFSIAIDYHQYAISAVATIWIALILILKLKNHMWWIEVVAITAILATLTLSL